VLGHDGAPLTAAAESVVCSPWVSELFAMKHLRSKLVSVRVTSVKEV
jgi:hypothetical protein